MSGPDTVPAYFQDALDRLGDRPLLEDRAGTVSLGALLADAAAAANSLEKRGLAAGDRVGLWADNSRRWILCDIAIQVAGGINCPRGTDTPEEEILEIFTHADVSVVVVHDKKTADRFERMRGSLPRVRDVIMLDPTGVADGASAGPVLLDRLVQEGRGGPDFRTRAARVRTTDVATIIYTSGTTGRPKGVVLTHSNFAHQLDTLPRVLDIGPTDVFLSILPPWHIFERVVEYVALTRGARLVYTDIRRFRQDLAEKSPTFVPSVPRIWEAVYDAIRKALSEGKPAKQGLFEGAYLLADIRARAQDRARGWVVREDGTPVPAASRFVAGLVSIALSLADLTMRSIVFRRLKALTGGKLRGAVVGGGLMPAHVDRFFRAVGVGVLVGYGLTETSPVVTVRREKRNVLGSIGTAIPGVEVQIRDAVSGKLLSAGEVGVIFTRGPHVMRGYHRDEELTRRVIDKEGWFDTGDLGMLTQAGDLCFRGRQKETIVLAGGENVEPSRVEAAILPSPLVLQAIVVGQDRKTLAALVVPRADAVAAHFKLDPSTSLADLVAKPEVQSLLREEVVRRTGSGSGLRPFEVVSRVHLLPEPLSPESGLLTATLKTKRHVVAKRFAGSIDALYAS